MKVHYLEIVSHDVDAVCKGYEEAHNVRFGEPEELLGGGRTCELPDGYISGVGRPLREDEDAVDGPYWLVEDIDRALAAVKSHGAQVAMHPKEIPGKGKFAIYFLGSNQHGLWQI
jgi:predicted enzyme related to lactoylglutathione lyase